MLPLGLINEIREYCSNGYWSNLYVIYAHESSEEFKRLTQRELPFVKLNCLKKVLKVCAKDDIETCDKLAVYCIQSYEDVGEDVFNPTDRIGKIHKHAKSLRLKMSPINKAILLYALRKGNRCVLIGLIEKFRIEDLNFVYNGYQYKYWNTEDEQTVKILNYIFSYMSDKAIEDLTWSFTVLLDMCGPPDLTNFCKRENYDDIIHPHFLINYILS